MDYDFSIQHEGGVGPRAGDLLDRSVRPQLWTPPSTSTRR